MPIELTRQLPPADCRIAIAVSRFTQDLSQRLLDGALQTLQQQGVPDANIFLVWVPGAFELPLACAAFAEHQQPDAILALGAVIRGETSHYDYVCGEAAAGIREVALHYGVPVLFGVLTCENRAQAEDRLGGSHGHKGAEVAQAALDMVGVMAAIQEP